MRTFTKTITLGLAILSIAATVGAAEAPKRDRDVAALENSRDAVAWQARNAKGVDQNQLREEQERLQGLIDTLNQGGRVEQSEVDRAVNRAR